MFVYTRRTLAASVFLRGIPTAVTTRDKRAETLEQLFLQTTAMTVLFQKIKEKSLIFFAYYCFAELAAPRLAEYFARGTMRFGR